MCAPGDLSRVPVGRENSSNGAVVHPCGSLILQHCLSTFTYLGELEERRFLCSGSGVMGTRATCDASCVGSAPSNTHLFSVVEASTAESASAVAEKAQKPHSILRVSIRSCSFVHTACSQGGRGNAHQRLCLFKPHLNTQKRFRTKNAEATSSEPPKHTRGKLRRKTRIRLNQLSCVLARNHPTLGSQK